MTADYVIEHLTARGQRDLDARRELGQRAEFDRRLRLIRGGKA